MSGFTYSIDFDILGQGALSKAYNSTASLDQKVIGLNASVSETKAGITGMANSSAIGLGKVENKAHEAGNGLKRMGDKGDEAFSKMKKSAMRFIAQVVTVREVYDSIKLGAEFQGIDNAIKFASGKEGEKNLKFLDQTVDALGLDVRSATEGFKLWTGGIMGTSMAGQKGRDTFWAVSEAATAMQLSGEQSKGVFLALSQIMSKGKVQAEELRGQLGERIPGALHYAAEAMGVSQSALNKMMEDGKLMSEDFLPKFATELHKTFGGAAVIQSQSAMANFKRMGNSIFDLKRTLGEELLPTATSMIDNFLIPSVSWLEQNIKLIGLLAASLGTAYLAVKSYNVIVAASAFVQGVWTGSIWATTAALYANPLGLVISLVVGLGAAVVYAWNKLEGFRGFLTGVWEAIKETGSVIYGGLIQPLLGLGKAFVGVITFDKDMILSGIHDAEAALKSNLIGIGARVAGAYNKGFKKGVDNFNAPALTDGYKPPDALSSAFADTPTGNPDDDDSSIKNGINSITTGGRSQKNITISLGSLVEQITLQSQNVSEGTDEIVDILLSKLLQILNTSNQAQ